MSPTPADPATRTVLCAIGTRPEVVKMAPVIAGLRATLGIRPVVLATAQHRELLDDATGFFGIIPDEDLDAMRPDQSLAELTGALIPSVARSLERWQPDLVLAQGDTTTVLAVAMAAAWQRAPFGHVEAGLRTGDPDNPFPEELNRRLVGQLARLHFAPTEGAAANLKREGVPADRVWVTGNPVVDALEGARGRVEPDRWRPAGGIPLVLVTLHRRENHGEGLARLAQGLRQLAEPGDVEILYPVHPNPNVSGPIRAALGGVSGVRLVAPMGYGDFLGAMLAADLVISDSGGVQEEACSLRVPVLVPRVQTERPEAVDSGWVELIGTDPEALVARARERIRDAAHQPSGATQGQQTPFGDGAAGGRIASLCASYLRDTENS